MIPLAQDFTMLQFTYIARWFHPTHHIHIFSPRYALNKLLHPCISNKRKLQILQQLRCSKFEKFISYKGPTCHFISILLPFPFLQQLTTNGFQVTPILVALFSSTVCIRDCSEQSSISLFFLSYITSYLHSQSD